MTSILKRTFASLPSIEACAVVSASTKSIFDSPPSGLMRWVITGHGNGGNTITTTVSKNNQQQQEQRADPSWKSRVAVVTQRHQHFRRVLRFFDPHFHIWDMGECHDPKTLAPFVPMFFKFLFSDLEKHIDHQVHQRPGTEVSSSSWEIQLCGGVHIEAIARDLDGLREIQWAKEQLEAYHHDHDHDHEHAQKKYFLSGYVNLLEKEKAEKTLRAFANEFGAVSVRQIVNFEPSWPFVDRNMLEDAVWLDNFSLLEKTGIKVFELQCNPHQLRAATRLAARYPRTNFVLNHLACLKGSDAVAKEKFDEWAIALEELVKTCPGNVFMKVSMMDYAFDPSCSSSSSGSNKDNNGGDDDDDGQQRHWTNAAVVRRVVGHVLKCFGPRRCMIASNYPVSMLPVLPSSSFSSSSSSSSNNDSHYVASARAWGRWLVELLSSFSDHDDHVEWLIRLTACKAYHVEV